MRFDIGREMYDYPRFRLLENATQWDDRPVPVRWMNQPSHTLPAGRGTDIRRDADGVVTAEVALYQDLDGMQTVIPDEMTKVLLEECEIYMVLNEIQGEEIVKTESGGRRRIVSRGTLIELVIVPVVANPWWRKSVTLEKP